MTRHYQHKECVQAVSLREAADKLEAEAYNLRREAEWRQEQYMFHRKARDLHYAIRYYIEKMEILHDHELAVRMTCSEYKLKDFYFKSRLKENHTAWQHYKRFNRNRQIIQRARRCSNVELAREFGLSPGQISRIIRREFRRYSTIVEVA